MLEGSAAESTPPAADDPATLGRLRVVSEPGGQVYVDDEPLGPTPLDSKLLSPGPYLVEVRKAGYVPAKRRVQVTAGKRAVVELRLDAAGGSR